MIDGLNPHQQCQQLFLLLKTCPAFHLPASYLLYTSPALPNDSIWLLNRTLRRCRSQRDQVKHLRLYGATSPKQVISLLEHCPQLWTLLMKTGRDGFSWESIWDYVGTRAGLRDVTWSGPRLVAANGYHHRTGFGLVGLLGSVEVLSLQNTSFLASKIIYLSSPFRLSAPSASFDCPSTFLTSLSLSACDVPSFFFTRLSPNLFSGLSSLELKFVRGLDRQDLLNGRSLLAPTLRTLTLLRDTQKYLSDHSSLGRQASLLPNRTDFVFSLH